MKRKVVVLGVVAVVFAAIAYFGCGGGDNGAILPVTTSNLADKWTRNEAGPDEIKILNLTKVSDTVLTANITYGNNTTDIGTMTILGPVQNANANASVKAVIENPIEEANTVLTVGVYDYYANLKLLNKCLELRADIVGNEDVFIYKSEKTCVDTAGAAPSNGGDGTANRWMFESFECEGRPNHPGDSGGEYADGTCTVSGENIILTAGVATFTIRNGATAGGGDVGTWSGNTDCSVIVESDTASCAADAVFRLEVRDCQNDACEAYFTVDNSA